MSLLDACIMRAASSCLPDLKAMQLHYRAWKYNQSTSKRRAGKLLSNVLRTLCHSAADLDTMKLIGFAVQTHLTTEITALCKSQLHY